MKGILAAVCCISMMTIPAVAQTHHAAREHAGAKAAMTDQQFVDFAGQTDMVEANLGQLAQDVAASQEVKDYGSMLATDHTDDYHHLQDAAKEANLTVPTAIGEEQNKTTIGPMHKLKGKAFDHRFIEDMIADHTKALAIYTKEANDAQSPAIKSYAEAALPVLHKHLDAAKNIAAGKPANTQP